MSTDAATHRLPLAAITANRRPGVPTQRAFREARVVLFIGEPSIVRQTIRRGRICAWWVK
jgi:hypothetical protein